MAKDSFILYADAYESIRSLALEQKGQLLDIIFMFQRGEELPIVDPVVDMAFSFIRRSFERDAAKYAKRCEKARESARMRWDANACERIKRNANHADTVPVPDTVPDKNISTPNSAEPGGHRPSQCSPEDWEKYLAYSRDFLDRQHQMWGVLVKVTESKVVAGAKALDNLIRVQDFPKKVVHETIEWAMADDFWSQQLRSLGSLTKKSKNDELKFSNILAKRAEEVKRAQRNAA